MTRIDGRPSDALRPVEIETRVQRFPEGSLLYRSGKTTVLVSVSVENSVPDWMRESGRGWLTAEYAMHPRANPDRKKRDGRRGRIDGRSSEIQRLIGRSLRAAVDMDCLGPRTITIDCDVLDADGGTRTAAISGGTVGLIMALDSLRKRGLVEPGVLREPIAAISVGLVQSGAMLDLCYEEDRDAEVDLNVVGTASGKLVEVQGTAEGVPVERKQLDAMLDMALRAMPTLVQRQMKALAQLDIDVDRLSD